MKKIFLSLILIFSLLFSFVTHAENVFYILHASPKQPVLLEHNLEIVKQNAQSIHILISQAYRVDETGNVSGFINPELLQLANRKAIKFMAMVTNSLYESDKVSAFLSSQSAQDKALQALLVNCQKYHFYGVQFDFENVPAADRKALTQFYLTAANVLHKNGFKVSFAVVPAFKNMNHSMFLKKSYEYLSGAYDLKTLSQAADFITLMAYNQHPDGTIPGPNASINYVKASVEAALVEIPANKLSLGIPTYSLYWYSGYDQIAAHQDEISYQLAKEIMQKHRASLVWDKSEKVYHASYEDNWLNQYIYFEEADSFKAKMAVIKQYHLRGMSVFRIGTEDGKIWGLLGKYVTTMSS